jgi:hypothetical protein
MNLMSALARVEFESAVDMSKYQLTSEDFFQILKIACPVLDFPLPIHPAFGLFRLSDQLFPVFFRLLSIKKQSTAIQIFYNRPGIVPHLVVLPE